ncbi:MAG: Tetratricopeptide repeat protein [Bacteroidetes bacterium ADurb.Bin408]|nr:MAG: Tetratricopeptide repeat protein [Bacteroidetes bacterium ADurb.Bin408]
MIYFNTGKNEQALQILKKVVADYPGTNASKDALVSIRDIYVNMMKTEEFFVYVKNIPFANVTRSEQDSISYIAIQNQYMSGDCNNTVQGFTDYLEKFPDGIFIINATFYRGECLYKSGKLKEALRDYTFVAGKFKTRFTESALAKAAAINFKQKNYNEALNFYNTLEEEAEIKMNVVDAQAGQMRCYDNLKNYEKAILAAKKITAQEKIEETLAQEAHLIMGRAYLAQNNTSFAQTEFLAVSRMAENEMKAEAKYNMALIQYNLANYKESEKIIFEIINQMPSYEYWIAKSFILLADNLVKMDNIFQAKHTLQSIIDNYEGLDLVQIAFEKLNKLNEAEKLKNQINPAVQDSLLNKPQQDSLFEIKY